jgi:hypothetical protein
MDSESLIHPSGYHWNESFAKRWTLVYVYAAPGTFASGSYVSMAQTEDAAVTFIVELSCLGR